MKIRPEPARLARELSVARAELVLRFTLLCVGCAAPRLLRAEAELALLHRRELARLLSEAALLRLGGDDADTLCGEAWRCALSDELASAATDGAQYSDTLRSVLELCAGAETVRWPQAAGLALAGCALHDSDRARLRLARAWQVQGELGLALALAQEALAGDPLRCARERWLALARELDSGDASEPEATAPAEAQPATDSGSDDRSRVGA